jgi:hypothetical protein
VSRVVVTGPRDEKDPWSVWDALDHFHLHDARGPITELGQGEAKGVDSFAKDWAEERGVPMKPYEADWDRYGDAAGAIRNGEMLDDFQPDYVLVFPRGGPGTTNCAKQARKKGFERIFIDEDLDPIEELTRWG